MIFSGPTWEDLYINAINEMHIINRWFCQNILSLNVDKTKCRPIVKHQGDRAARRPETCAAPMRELQLLGNRERDNGQYI